MESTVDNLETDSFLPLGDFKALFPSIIHDQTYISTFILLFKCRRQVRRLESELFFGQTLKETGFLCLQELSQHCIALCVILVPVSCTLHNFDYTNTVWINHVSMFKRVVSVYKSLDLLGLGLYLVDFDTRSCKYNPNNEQSTLILNTWSLKHCFAISGQIQMHQVFEMMSQASFCVHPVCASCLHRWISEDFLHLADLVFDFYSFPHNCYFSLTFWTAEAGSTLMALYSLSLLCCIN